MREQYMRCGEGFMICYSVTDLHSFQEIMEYKKLISRVRANEEIPVVLVGNKFDLQQRRKVTTDIVEIANISNASYTLRTSHTSYILYFSYTFCTRYTSFSSCDTYSVLQVSTEEGKALAKELGCPFYETSAVLRQFVDDAFYSLVRQIRAKERRGVAIRKTSRWSRLRSIFSLIFRRRKRTFHTS